MRKQVSEYDYLKELEDIRFPVEDTTVEIIENERYSNISSGVRIHISEYNSSYPQSVKDLIDTLEMALNAMEEFNNEYKGCEIIVDSE